MNYDRIPNPERSAYFEARGAKPVGFVGLETSGAELRVIPARTAYFLGKQAAARNGSPIKPARSANRFAERDAADRRRLEAKRHSPVFVTDDLRRAWENRR